MNGEQAVWQRDLAEYGISERGFLPEEPPLARFQDAESFDTYDNEMRNYLATLDAFYAAIPDMVEAEEIEDHIRNQAWKLPEETPDGLYDQLSEQEHLAMYRGSAFAASAYVHAVGKRPVDHVPHTIARNLYESAERIGVPPILSYDAYSLYNWQLDDSEAGVTLDNVNTIQNFVNLPDEDWFMLVHVEIEDEAAPAVTSIPEAQRAVVEDDADALYGALETMRDALAETVETMARMPEGNSPENYESEFRPYIEKFAGIEYVQVDELDGPQSFRGETGAQSSIYPALDGAFDIPHEKNELTKHIDDMRPYMPDGHRRFIEDVERASENGAGITAYVAEHGDEELEALHDDVLWNMNAFRSLHNFYAHRYIADKTDDPRGTGDTDFKKFLGQLIEETEEQMFRNGPTNALDYTMEALGRERFGELMSKFASSA